MGAINGTELRCDRQYVWFHGYQVFRVGLIYGKSGKMLKFQERKRRTNDTTDLTVKLYYNGKAKKWTVHRLIAACFLGPIDGYEINHIDMNTHNNFVGNLERVTSSQNVKHFHKHKRKKQNEKNN